MIYLWRKKNDDSNVYISEAHPQVRYGDWSALSPDTCCSISCEAASCLIGGFYKIEAGVLYYVETGEVTEHRPLTLEDYASTYGAKRHVSLVALPDGSIAVCVEGRYKILPRCYTVEDLYKLIISDNTSDDRKVFVYG